MLALHLILKIISVSKKILIKLITIYCVPKITSDKWHPGTYNVTLVSWCLLRVLRIIILLLLLFWRRRLQRACEWLGVFPSWWREPWFLSMSSRTHYDIAVTASSPHDLWKLSLESDCFPLVCLLHLSENKLEQYFVFLDCGY